MKEYITLDKLNKGQRARIKRVLSVGAIRRRFFDIGLIMDTQIECVCSSPLGGIKAYNVCGMKVAIRDCDAKNVLVTF